MQPFPRPPVMRRCPYNVCARVRLNCIYSGCAARFELRAGLAANEGARGVTTVSPRMSQFAASLALMTSRLPSQFKRRNVRRPQLRSELLTRVDLEAPVSAGVAASFLLGVVAFISSHPRSLLQGVRHRGSCCPGLRRRSAADAAGSALKRLDTHPELE